MTLKTKGKGNIKEQRKRRKERLKDSVRMEDTFELIDGNWSFYPVAYCTSHGGYLTQGLVDTHRCIERSCVGFRKGIDNEED